MTGLLAMVAGRLGSDSRAIRNHPVVAPTCSLWSGAGGIGYFFYRLALLENDRDHLAVADAWLDRAVRRSSALNAFANPGMGYERTVTGPISLYHTVGGVHAVRALVKHALGDRATVERATRRFIATGGTRHADLDLTFGRSSVLLGCGLLLNALGGHPYGSTPALERLGDRLEKAIWSGLERGRLESRRRIEWLGMAHGWAGVLYATLRWRQVRGRALSVPAVRRLHHLADRGVRGAGWMEWPLSIIGKAPDRSAWPGWCHGSAGYVHLWTLAHEMTGDERFLDLATGAARGIMRPGAEGADLCCGLAGQAYAHLRLYRYTGEKQWLHCARRLANAAASSPLVFDAMPDSLFKGEVGVAMLMADMKEPKSSCMPLFEPEPGRTGSGADARRRP